MRFKPRFVSGLAILVAGYAMIFFHGFIFDKEIHAIFKVLAAGINSNRSLQGLGFKPHLRSDKTIEIKPPLGADVEADLSLHDKSAGYRGSRPKIQRTQITNHTPPHQQALRKAQR